MQEPLAAIVQRMWKEGLKMQTPTNAEISAWEAEARFIETVILPAYSAANAMYDGKMVERSEVYADFEQIVKRLRERDKP